MRLNIEKLRADFILKKEINNLRAKDISNQSGIPKHTVNNILYTNPDGYTAETFISMLLWMGTDLKEYVIK